ncbi:MAG: BolA family transcriptional regulator [Burkholderiales bacterium]|nr:MAG: BolA family transcriptional regulator [Burkholderiales bacterium]
MVKPSVEALHERLLRAFPDAQIEISDDSHLHAGHEGARSGAGHFRVRLVSARFGGLNRIQRHRLVYDAVADWMPHRVHALVIEAQAPAEAAGQRPSSEPG